MRISLKSAARLSQRLRHYAPHLQGSSVEGRAACTEESEHALVRVARGADAQHLPNLAVPLLLRPAPRGSDERAFAAQRGASPRHPSPPPPPPLVLSGHAASLTPCIVFFVSGGMTAGGVST